MAQLTDILTRLETFDQGAAINAAIRDNEKDVIELNTKSQLFDKGILSSGAKLPKYRPTTVKIKKSKGQPYNRMTLFDTGEFHGSFRIKYLKDGIQIESSGRISDTGEDLAITLPARYTTAIFGLTEANIKKMQAIIAGELVKELEAFWQKVKN